VPLRIEIAREHRSTCSLGQRRQQNPNRPLPDHEHGLVRLQIQQLHGFEACVHRLDEGCLFK